ncbi:MAG: hypothetical protein QXR48_01335 [Candidatus Woesearchaeota archaeon]
MTKKGQLTIFIIIGLVLLVAVGVFIYLTQQKAVRPLEAAEIKVAEVAVEVQPLQEFITQCLYVTARQGLEMIGERGGYIDPQQKHNPFDSTEGSAVQFAPGSKLKVPYWWHMSSKNNCRSECEFKSERPSLEEIENQMNNYIKKQLPNCIGDFEKFKEQAFTITPAGEIKPTTQITKRNVVVRLEYPLEATKATERFELKEFATELPVNFYEIYSLATNITNLEAEHTFLERATRNLIDIFGRADSNALPPVSEMEFGFGTGTIWTKFDVKEKVMQMLTSYIPMLKVTYTKNYKYLMAPAGKDKKMYEILYNRGFTVPVLEPHKDLSVKFSYLPWWNPYFDLNCNGQLCQPEGFSSTLGFLFGVRRYNFAYGISYPVLVEITNPEAFKGEGYSLRFFLEANMRNNEPLATMGPPLAVAEIAERSSLLCDPLQKTSGEITINIRNSAGMPVDNAEILYRCGQETCHIGTSSDGKLIARLPRCIGGLISANHPDYPPASKPLDIIDASNNTIDLVLQKGYPVNFIVKKWMLMKTGNVSGTAGWELETTNLWNQGPRENTIIMLERKQEEFEEPMTILGEVCGAPASKAPVPCGRPPSDISRNITLYAGDYHVTIQSFLYPSPDLVIPPEKRKFSRGPGRSPKRVLVPPTQIVFNKEKPLMSGYAEYDWTITEEQLQAAKTIQFTYIYYALDKVLPASRRKVEDLEVMGALFDYSEPYKDLLTPVIVTE